MQMLLDNLSSLGANPVAWVVAALVVAKAASSAFMLAYCPVQRGLVEVTEEKAAEAKNARFHAPLSFLLLVLLGMGMAVGGLFMLADATYGAIALAAMVIGAFIMLTEPNRLQMIAARNSVFAATPEGGEPLFMARGALKGIYRKSFLLEAMIALAVISALYFM